MSNPGLPDPAMARFSWNTGYPAYQPYQLRPLLAKIPDDNERPRRYSGNSHQRRKQRRALRPCPGCSLCKGVGCYACYPKFDQDCDACVDGLSVLCDGSGVLPAKRSGVFG